MRSLTVIRKRHAQFMTRYMGAYPAPRQFSSQTKAMLSPVDLTQLPIVGQVKDLQDASGHFRFLLGYNDLSSFHL